MFHEFRKIQENNKLLKLLTNISYDYSPKTVYICIFIRLFVSSTHWIQYKSYEICVKEANVLVEKCRRDSKNSQSIDVKQICDHLEEKLENICSDNNAKGKPQPWKHWQLCYTWKYVLAWHADRNQCNPGD